MAGAILGKGRLAKDVPRAARVSLRERRNRAGGRSSCPWEPCLLSIYICSMSPIFLLVVLSERLFNRWPSASFMHKDSKDLSSCMTPGTMTNPGAIMSQQHVPCLHEAYSQGSRFYTHTYIAKLQVLWEHLIEDLLSFSEEVGGRPGKVDIWKVNRMSRGQGKG